MAWIELHQSLREHRKILALAAELDMPEAHVSGHCIYLWLWSLDNAPDGTLPKSARIIERAAGWMGVPGIFVEAMITVGMIEQDDEALLIHDWYDYAGRIIDKRKENAERMKSARAEKKIERATNVQNTCNARAGATVPNRTLPKDKRDPPSANALGIQIESHVQVGGAQSQTGNGQRPSAEKPNEYTYEFELFWNSYPRRIEKKSASKAWQARLRDGINSQDIIRAAQHYAKECERNKTDAKFIKHPKTFLGSNTPFEEYVDSEHLVTASRETEPQQIGRYIPRGLAKEVIAAMEEDERERQRVIDAQADSS